MWNLVQSIMYGILFVSDGHENDGGGDARLWSYIWQIIYVSKYNITGRAGIYVGLEACAIGR